MQFVSPNLHHVHTDAANGDAGQKKAPADSRAAALSVASWLSSPSQHATTDPPPDACYHRCAPLLLSLDEIRTADTGGISRYHQGVRFCPARLCAAEGMEGAQTPPW